MLARALEPGARSTKVTAKRGFEWVRSVTHSGLPNDIASGASASRQEAGIFTAFLGLGVVAYTPNPVGLVHP